MGGYAEQYTVAGQSDALTDLTPRGGGGCPWPGGLHAESRVWSLAITHDQADQMEQLMAHLVPPETAALMDQILEEAETARALLTRS